MLLHGGLFRVQLADYLALVHDEYAVRKAHDLVELQAHEQYRLAGVPLGHELAMYVFDGADVQAARRLDGHDQGLFAVELTGDDRLLLVAAGHAARRRHGALAGAHVEFLY